MMEREDRELVIKSRYGEHEAFDLLVQKYWKWSLTIAYGLVNDHAASEDVTQEAFVNAWQKLDQLAEPDSFKQWFRRIVINQAMMYLRKRRPNIPLEEMEGSGIAYCEEPEPDIREQEDIESVYKAMQSLGVRHRLLMMLFYLDGLSQRDIGELLEISESIVKSRLHDARTRIRKEISMENVNDRKGENIVCLRGVNLRPLEEDSPWLEDIDLDVNKGELLALTGPQHSGKGALLKVIGLLEKPGSGTVQINGIDISDLDPVKFVEIKVGMFGYLWMQPQLGDQMSCVENVILPLITAGIERSECIERSVEALRFVEIDEKKKEVPVRLLSLLDQQKVALARALVSDPDVIIAHEPTGNMRSSELVEFDRLLARTVRERNVSIVCASHDLNIMKAADRLVWMQDGRIAKIGTFDEGPPKYMGRGACVFRYPASLSEGLYYSRKYKGIKEDLLRDSTEKYQQAVKKITVLRGKSENTDEELIALQIKEFQEAIGMLNDVVSNLKKTLET